MISPTELVQATLNSSGHIQLSKQTETIVDELINDFEDSLITTIHTLKSMPRIYQVHIEDIKHVLDLARNTNYQYVGLLRDEINLMKLEQII